MSAPRSTGARIGRLGYWLYFVGLMTAAGAMFAWGLYELLVLGLMPIVFGFVAPAIVLIWFRIIAGRRCRDIGWPAWLPWLTIGLVFAVNIVGGVAGGLQAGLHAGAPANLGALGAAAALGGVLGLADFVFLIVIGCVAGTAADDAAAADLPLHPPVARPTAIPNGPPRMPPAYGEAAMRAKDAPAYRSPRTTPGFGRRAV